MKLSLSGRIAEAEDIKDYSSIDFSGLVQLAASVGFKAVCVRPTHLSSTTPLERVHEMRATLDRHGLAASMVTADSRVPREGSVLDAGVPLRDLEPILTRANALGADLIRVGVKTEDDIVWAQRAADEAREYGIQLAQQTHTATPFETAAGCKEMIERIDRPNFGLILEPANFALCGEDYGPSALAPLGTSVFNVYVQNLRVTDSGDSSVETNSGTVRYERLVIGDPIGIDLPRFFDGLSAIDYQGYVTSHQPAIPGMSEHSLCEQVYAELARFVGP